MCTGCRRAEKNGTLPAGPNVDNDANNKAKSARRAREKRLIKQNSITVAPARPLNHTMNEPGRFLPAKMRNEQVRASVECRRGRPARGQEAAQNSLIRCDGGISHVIIMHLRNTPTQQRPTIVQIASLRQRCAFGSAAGRPGTPSRQFCEPSTERNVRNAFNRHFHYRPALQLIEEKMFSVAGEINCVYYEVARTAYEMLAVEMHRAPNTNERSGRIEMCPAEPPPSAGGREAGVVGKSHFV